MSKSNIPTTPEELAAALRAMRRNAVQCFNHDSGGPVYAMYAAVPGLGVLTDAAELIEQQARELPADDPIRQLIVAHADLLDQYPYCYFELAWTRRTGWMAWLTDKPARGELGTVEFAQSRKVLARGQGDSAEEACRDALAALATSTG